jgi:hypothetical protein
MLTAGSRRLEITSSKMGGITLAPAEVKVLEVDIARKRIQLALMW